MNSNHEYSVGLWQINLNAHKDKYGDLHNALNNAKAAYEISNHGKDMRPWTTTHPHNKGTGADYRTYLPEVQKEIGLAGDPRGTDGYGTPLHRQLIDADYERYFATRPGWPTRQPSPAEWARRAAPTPSPRAWTLTATVCSTTSSC